MVPPCSRTSRVMACNYATVVQQLWAMFSVRHTCSATRKQPQCVGILRRGSYFDVVLAVSKVAAKARFE